MFIKTFTRLPHMVEAKTGLQSLIATRGLSTLAMLLGFVSTLLEELLKKNLTAP